MPAVKYEKLVEKYSSLIIEGKKLETYENNVSDFNIEVKSPTGDISYHHIQAYKKNDFIYAGLDNLVINNLKNGDIYQFRVRVTKNDNSYSNWSQWWSETVGDVTNELTFSPKLDNSTPPVDISVVNTSTSTTFSVTINNVPSDFDSFEWVVQELPANLTDNPLSPPTAPIAPSTNYAPDYTTTSLNDASISLTKNRTTWFYCWIRALDKSGNIGSQGWYYIGAGKISSIDSQSDQDDMPPDNTDITTASATWASSLNFI